MGDYGASIWGPMLISMLMGAFGGKDGQQPLMSADQASIQSLLKSMLENQFGDENYVRPLKQRIQNTANALLPDWSNHATGQPISFGNVGPSDPDPNHGGVTNIHPPGTPPGPNTPIIDPGAPRVPPVIDLPTPTTGPRMGDTTPTSAPPSINLPSPTGGPRMTFASAAAGAGGQGDSSAMMTDLMKYLAQYGGRQ